MDTSSLARAYAGGRIALGAVFCLAPGLTRLFAGPAGGEPTARLLVRMVGVRDIALGVGALRALGTGEPARGWFRAGATSDAVDVVASLLAARHLPTAARLVLVALTAAGGAATGFTLAERLD